MEKTTPKKDGFRYGVNRFLSGRLYIALVMLLVFLGNVLSLDVPMAAAVILLALFGFLFAHDLRFLLPPLLSFICIIPITHTPYVPTESDFYTTGFRPYFIGVLAVFVALGLLFFLIRNRAVAKAAPTPSLAIGFAALLAALVLSGLLRDYAVRNLVYGIGIGLPFLAIYLLFSFYHPKTKANAEHFLFTLLAVGLLVSAELFVRYATGVRFEGGVPVKETVLLGWGTWTQIGAMLTLCLPAPFYFARSSRRFPLYLGAGAIMVAALLMTASRGAWLYGAVVLLACVFLLVAGGKNRVFSRILACMLFGLFLLAALILLPKIIAFVSTFLKSGLGDNGRFTLWQTAVRDFLSAPAFGVGAWGPGIVLDFPPIMPYLYHNTVLQFLGAGGAVGLLLYLLHRVETVRLLLRRRRSALSLFLLLVAFALVLVSLTDEHFFHIYPSFFYAVALSLAEGRYEDGSVFEK